MNCCTPEGYRTIFGDATVARDVRRYRRKGLAGSARWLSRAVGADGLGARSVLEVGGGIGSLQIELLEAGAATATNVELVSSYEPAARELLVEHGLDGRVDRRIADFAASPDEAPISDIVVMHRVLCCYPDPDALLAAACDRARERVAITVPVESWWVRLGFWSMNAWFRVRRIGFRAYVHPVSRMLDVAGRHGFAVRYQSDGAIWRSFVLGRGDGGAAPGAGAAHHP
jgi:hypothetical protein